MSATRFYCSTPLRPKHRNSTRPTAQAVRAFLIQPPLTAINPNQERAEVVEALL